MTRTAAVGYYQSLPIDEPDSLVDLEIDVDQPAGHDLLVEVRAVSVNPADVKNRASSSPDGGTEPRILGFDAAGIVRTVGDDVVHFAVGDEVFYSGTINRRGSNAGLQLIDERIVGHKPKTLDFAQAAALPLTSVTAWEVLFDRLALKHESDGILLVMAAAGGVGSMIVQLARQLTDVTVIAATSRPEAAKWAEDLGAHHTVNRHHLADEVHALAKTGIDYVFTSFSPGNVEIFAELLKPRGEIVAIDEPEGLDTLPLKAKSQTWHWELMFTRPLYEPESNYQHEVLEQVSQLVDSGVLRTTMTTMLSPIDAEHLRQAHALVESSATIGKVVVASEGSAGRGTDELGID
jgi:NADPH2:quinone reductase